jgi:TRAP-type C4-dicarboxylate transport system substrate-binding protein
MGKMKGLLCVVLVIVLLAMPTVAVCQDKPIVLTLASAYSFGVKKWVLEALEWIEQIESRTGGRIKIDVKGGPEVTPPKDLLKACQRGMFDLVYTAAPYYAGQLPIIQIATFINPAKQKELVANRDMYYFTNRLLQKYNVKYMSELQTGQQFYVWTNKKPAMEGGKVVSLKGLQIRSIGTLNAKQIEAMEGTPTVLPPAEMYEALRRGVVDGIVSRSGSVAEYHMDEVLSYLMRPAPLVISGVFYMNKDSFDRLPKDLQKAIDDLNIESAVNRHDVLYEQEESLIGGFVKKGTIKTLQANADMLNTMTNTRGELLKIMADSEPKMKDEIIEKFNYYYK